jgi:hypothetical protein
VKVELKNVKSSKSLSQESNAYTADIWIDGVRRGSVSNHGTGGQDMVKPFSLAEELFNYAKILPEISAGLSGDLADKTMPQSVDSLLFEAYSVVIEGKRLAKLMKTKIVFIYEGRVYTGPISVAVQPGSIVLNKLPFDVAVKEFLKFTS